MALETGTYISDLVATNPAAGDDITAGDDHLRLLKATLLATFPNLTGAVTPTHTELNYVDGVTSAIQTQLDAKAPLASPALTGTPTAPTATAGTNTTQIATTAFVSTAVGGIASPGAWTLIKSTAASSVATVDFANGSGGVVINSTYDEYMIVLIAVRPSTDNQILIMRTSTDAGSTFSATTNDYVAALTVSTYTSVVPGAGATTGLYLTDGVGNSTNEQGVYGVVRIYAPSTAAYTHIDYFTSHLNASGVLTQVTGCGYRATAADVDAIRFLFASGNIASGTLNLYGRRK